MKMIRFRRERKKTEKRDVIYNYQNKAIGLIEQRTFWVFVPFESGFIGTIKKLLGLCEEMVFNSEVELKEWLEGVG